MRYIQKNFYCWIFPLNTNFKTISPLEIREASRLPTKKAIQYRLSRGNIRYALSKLFSINPLEVPLNSLPGNAPSLSKNFGYVSMSHCSDALFIGWSKDKIGVDIERIDRKLVSTEIANRFFDENDILSLKGLSRDLYKEGFLKIWVVKESLIKWQNGSLLKGLKEWKINEKSGTASHKNLKLNVNINNFRFLKWEIGIASSVEIRAKDIKIELIKR